MVLIGNLHARQTSGTFGRTFMVQALIKQGLAVTALSYRSGEGSARYCTGFKEDTCSPARIGKARGCHSR